MLNPRRINETYAIIFTRIHASQYILRVATAQPERGSVLLSAFEDEGFVDENFGAPARRTGRGT